MAVFVAAEIALFLRAEGPAREPAGRLEREEEGLRSQSEAFGGSWILG
jgi:hypothetical protein